MKFSVGFITGAIVGGVVVSNMTEQQRRDAAEKANALVKKAKSSTVGSAVVDNVSDVSDAAGNRVAEAVDKAGSTVTSAVASDTAPASVNGG